jgi:suppressor of fused-like protein
MNSEIDAPGWGAIDNALQPIYHEQVPKHYGTLISYELGGPDPLRGISAYKRLEPAPHWHFVTYGFSELYEKTSDIKEESGWGFELTFRLKTEPDSEDPPVWVLNFLQNLARYVFQTGNEFGFGQYMKTGPLALDVDTQICSILFAQDPELPPIDTPNGRLKFIQVIGITDDEELAVKQWMVVKALGIFQVHLPLLITDLHRPSLLANPDVKNRLIEGATKDGSNTGFIFIDQLSWQEERRLLGKPVMNVTLGARTIAELLALLPYRLPHQRTFKLVGEEQQIILNPSANNAYRMEDRILQLDLGAETVGEMCARLMVKEGIYDLPSFPNLHIHVKKTFVKDPAGKIVETIG